MQKLRGGESMTRRERFALTMLLAAPAILAQLSMCLMSYIDASMVGRLGSAQAAAVGLVSSTVWIFGSFCYSNATGFSVQIAHKCGARDYDSAKSVFHKGLLTTFCASLMLCLLAALISSSVPAWLGGGKDIIGDAAEYFLIYALFIPLFQIDIFAEAALIASGNLKVPSITSLAMCVMDVIFNYIFIFVLDMGVRGAALGTGLAELCAGAFLLVYALKVSPELRQDLSWLQPSRRIPGYRSAGLYKALAGAVGSDDVLGQALHISWPLWLQNLISRGAYIAATVLVAPLGTIAIAANSFAIIAEGFCYLPGYGMQDAATTLVGQSLGARRRDMARSFARMTIFSGAAMMTAFAVLMWIFAPELMGLLTPDETVVALGAKCLRIEAWAEFFFGVSIVAAGCCVGAGDSLFTSVANLVSMWVVRIGLALLLIPRYGLEGYWVAMATELSVKGIIFAFRIRGSRWMKTKLTAAEN